MDSIEDIVAAGVEAQLQIDKFLAKAYTAARNLTQATEDGVAQGMVRGIAAKEIIGVARSLQGRVGDLAADFASLHRTQTDACIASGVDMGNVTTAGGVPIGGVGTESGGR